MSPLQHSNNIAARMGRWSASHWKTAVFGWLAFVVAALVLGQMGGTKTINQNDASVGQSHKAETLLRDAGFQADPQQEIVLIQSETLTYRDAAFRKAIDDTVAAVRPFRTIKELASPLAPGNADQISSDGHTVLVTWTMKGDDKVAAKNIDALTGATAAVAERHPALY